MLSAYRGSIAAPVTPPAGDFWADLIPGALLQNSTELVFTGSEVVPGPVMTPGGTIFASVTFTSLPGTHMLCASGAQQTTQPGINWWVNTNDFLASQNSDGFVRRTNVANTTAIPVGQPIALRLRWQQGAAPNLLEFDWTNGTIGGAQSRDLTEMVTLLADPVQSWVIGRNFSSGNPLLATVHLMAFYGARADDTQWADGLAELL